MNKFLAEELARACRYNKSHNCFTADLQAFKSSQYVDAAIKRGLQGLDTYAKVYDGTHTFNMLARRICIPCMPLCVRGLA